MRLSFIIAFLALPLLELALLIKTGQAIGFWATVAIMIATAVLGGMVLRNEGFSAMRRFEQVSEALTRGEAPVAAVLDHVLMISAGLLLILPGLITDSAGLLLLVPPIRTIIGRWVTTQFSIGPIETPAYRGGKGGATDPTAGPTIEGEFTRLDE